MIQFNNHNITAIEYGGHTIKKVYGACSNDPIWEYSEPTPPPTPDIPANTKFYAQYRTLPDAYIECDGNVLTASEMYNSPMPTAITEITYAYFGSCAGSIPDYAIGSYGQYLTGTTIENGILRIGNSAFMNTRLKSVVIPPSVATIAQNAFASDSVDRPSQLTSVTFPTNAVESIRIRENAFSGCTALTSVVLNRVYRLDAGAFRNCYSLTSVTMGDSVSRIEATAFNGCISLARFTIYTVTPPTIGSQVFDNIPTTIYVPSESVNAYKTASNWSRYADRIQAII